MIFQKLLLQYSNSRNHEKWRLAVTTEFRVKLRFLWGEHSYQHKNIVLLRESRLLEIGCALPVYSIFTLRAEEKLNTPQNTQNGHKVPTRKIKERPGMQRSCLPKVRYCPGKKVKTTVGATGISKVHTEEVHYESHRKVYEKLRIVEQLMRYLLNVILSMVITIILPVQSPDSHCRCINYNHLYQCNLNISWSERLSEQGDSWKREMKRKKKKR